MSENWTKGPWTVGPCANAGLLLRRGSTRDHQQSSVQIVPAEDAHLIAAAPELYEALQEARLQISYLHDKFKETGTGNAVIAKIDAALSKARGEAKP